MEFKEGKVIKEPELGRLFTKNPSYPGFERVSELHMFDTPKLYLMKGACKRGSNDVEFLSCQR